MSAGLLIVALLCNFVPELIAQALGHSVAGWWFIADNVQIACLWWLAGVMAEKLARLDASFAGYLIPTLAVCAYGVFEAIQAPICRLAFPMTAAPPRHPEGLCAAAGVPTYELSPLIIALCGVAFASALCKLPVAQQTRSR